MRIDNSTKGSSLFAENHEVGELVVSVRQGLQETVVWAIAERDIPNRWNYQNLHLGRINGAFEVIVSATRFHLNFVGCQKGDHNDKTQVETLVFRSSQVQWFNTSVNVVDGVKNCCLEKIFDLNETF